MILNETKSTHINFTYQKVNNMTININSQKIQYASTAKYLGMTLDTKLKWKERVKKKKEELNIKFRKMNWLLGRHSELTIHNKLCTSIPANTKTGMDVWHSTLGLHKKIKRTDDTDISK